MSVYYVADLKLNLFLDGVVVWSKKQQLARWGDGLRRTGAAALSGDVPDCG